MWHTARWGRHAFGSLGATSAHSCHRPPKGLCQAVRCRHDVGPPRWPSGLRQRTSNPFYGGSNPSRGARWPIPRRPSQRCKSLVVTLPARRGRDSFGCWGTCSVSNAALGVGTYVVSGQLWRRHQPEWIECFVCYWAHREERLTAPSGIDAGEWIFGMRRTGPPHVEAPPCRWVRRVIASRSPSATLHRTERPTHRVVLNGTGTTTIAGTVARTWSTRTTTGGGR